MTTTQHPDAFVNRHIGPDSADVDKMLRAVGAASLEELIAQTVPASIRLERALDLPAALSEHALLEKLEGIAARNQIHRSFLGMGYSDCVSRLPAGLTRLLRTIHEHCPVSSPVDSP